MTRRILTSIVSRGLRSIDRVSAPAVADAHCDIPCGIYDPHLMQVAALTIVRMHQLIDALERPAPDAPIDARNKAFNSFVRYSNTKEDHSEIVKREVRIIWGDYFKPEHLEKYPNLHDTFWKAAKLCSKNKTEQDPANGEALLGAIEEIHNMFWGAKGRDVAFYRAS